MRLSNAQIVVLGPGQMFGEEDAVAERERAGYTVRCKSMDGEVFAIGPTDFRRILRNNETTWNSIINNCQNKEFKCLQRLTKAWKVEQAQSVEPSPSRPNNSKL